MSVLVWEVAAINADVVFGSVSTDDAGQRFVGFAMFPGRARDKEDLVDGGRQSHCSSESRSLRPRIVVR